MTFNTANAFDIICRLDRDDTLDEVPQNKKQKVATGLLLDKLHKQDFAGPLASRASRVSGPISRHRVADILAPHETCFACFSSWVARWLSFASSVMGSVLHGYFTQQSMITPAVLNAQMNLTLSLITMNVPGCTASLSLSGDMLRYCHKEIISYMT